MQNMISPKVTLKRFGNLNSPIKFEKNLTKNKLIWAQLCNS